jgi:hypothetical protein
MEREDLDIEKSMNFQKNHVELLFGQQIQLLLL